MNEWVKKNIKYLLKTTTVKRRAFFLVTDILLIAFSMYISFWMRFDGDIQAEYRRNMHYYIALALTVKICLLAAYGMYNHSWRFFGLKEMIRLFSAVTLSSFGLGVFLFFFKELAPFERFPRSVLLLDYIFTLGLIGSLRISKRAFREYLNRTRMLRRGRIKILIIGAGEAGEQIGREMLHNRKSKYFPEGYIDDNPAKGGLNIHGVKVLGTREDIPGVLASNDIDEVLVAIPSADSKEIRKIVEIVRNSNAKKKIKILPGIIDFVESKATLSDIQEIRVEDLLGREPVEIDYDVIRRFLRGRRVLLTGAGGSIGSELSRTALQFEPNKLVLVDIDETELFYLKNRLGMLASEVVPVIGDVRDAAKMAALFEKHRPEIVLHSAAYKHVPILEFYPEEAVKTNILGTRILGELALKYGVASFVNISTDKAINPTSVMGSTKRVGEELLKVLNGKNGTKFISVRFGNVLGSRGSVIPLFTEQIKKGGPVTVTHPEMKRYFMATSEAVLLVLEAAATGEGGEAYILDMGEPVKILDLAREMIRLSGYEPDVDIPIVYIGLRAGEKLYEELLGAEEGSEPTEHAKIFKVKDSRLRNEQALWGAIERLAELCVIGGRRDEFISCIQKIVPTYKSDEMTLSISHW